MYSWKLTKWRCIVATKTLRPDHNHPSRKYGCRWKYSNCLHHCQSTSRRDSRVICMSRYVSMALCQGMSAWHYRYVKVQQHGIMSRYVHAGETPSSYVCQGMSAWHYVRVCQLGITGMLRYNSMALCQGMSAWHYVMVQQHGIMSRYVSMTLLLSGPRQ